MDTVTDPHGHLGENISTGSLITGYYCYDTTPSESYSDLYMGQYIYDFAPCGIFLNVEGIAFETDIENVHFELTVENEHCHSDTYQIVSYNNLPFQNNIDIHIDWTLFDLHFDEDGPITDILLPLTAPVLDDWESNYLSIQGDEIDDFHIQAHVTSVQIVPEPMIFVLLVAGYTILRKRII